MPISTEWIEYPSGGEPMQALLARPAGVDEPLPAIVVIQEIWGIDPHMEDVARRFAAAGYVSLAPDLYSRGGRPEALSRDRVEAAKGLLDRLAPAAWWDPAAREAELAKLPAAERERVGSALERLLSPARPMTRWVADLQAASGWLRDSRAARGRRVGSVGFCMGGALSAMLAAAEPRLWAAVIYYGASPSLEQAVRIRCPVLGLYGEDDPRIVSGLGAFADAMRGANRRFDHHVYPRTPHAFFNDTRPSYRPEAARDAWARTLSFLCAELSPVP
jgi:carboxymethylenebutenolidase